MIVQHMIEKCQHGEFEDAHKIFYGLWKQGYSSLDLISTSFFHIIKYSDVKEYLKLEFLKEVGKTHMLVLNGVNSLLQLSALIARLCTIAKKFTKKK